MPDNSTLTDDEVFDAFVRLPEESRGRLMSQFAAWNKSGDVSPASDSISESMLLKKIQDSSPNLDFQRYADLRKKLDSESLTNDEHRELKGMIEQLENAHASRMKLVAQLSKLRSETLDDTMNSLDLNLAIESVRE